MRTIKIIVVTSRLRDECESEILCTAYVKLNQQNKCVVMLGPTHRNENAASSQQRSS
jgi:hypothetical protein